MSIKKRTKHDESYIIKINDDSPNIIDDISSNNNINSSSIYSHLNQNQQDIVSNFDFTHNKQALCIIACAGSGKTTTIIHKILYMIKYLNCTPSDFILTTFTRNAAEEMKKRILTHLDKETVNNITIGTFHSIALSQIIKSSYKIESNKPESMPEEYLIKYLELLNDPNYIIPYKYIFIDEYLSIYIMK